MRLVEVVMLMGAHCVSPVEHGQLVTEAAKVQCAVVIEKDTDTGTMTVTPGTAASEPQVVAAIARFRTLPGGPPNAADTTNVPTPAPAPIAPPTDETATGAPHSAAPPATAPAAAAAAISTPTAPARVVSSAEGPEPPRAAKAATSAPPPKRPPVTAAARRVPAVRQPAAATQHGQCRGTTTARWYTASDGHRRYRCVKAGGNGASGQIY